MTNPDGTKAGITTSYFTLKVMAIVTGALMVIYGGLDVNLYWATVAAIIGVYSAIRWDTHRRVNGNHKITGDTDDVRHH